MAWAKLDDQFYCNEKQLTMSDPAFRLYVCSLSFAAQDREPTGFLSRARARALAGMLHVGQRSIEELVELNAWEDVDDGTTGGWLIHDFDQYVDQGSGERMRRWRSSLRSSGLTDREMTALRMRVFERDQFTCRYCGRKPDPKLLVADHIVPTPEGPSTEENLVASCRSCNRRKGKRTPEQAGMALLPLPVTVTSSVSNGDSDRARARARGNPGPEPVPVISNAPPVRIAGRELERSNDRTGHSPANGPSTLSPEASELLVGYHALLGLAPTARDLGDAEEFVTSFGKYLTPAEMLARMAQHLEWCDDHGKNRPRTLKGFYGSLRQEYEHRADAGAGPRRSSAGGMEKIDATIDRLIGGQR